MPFLRKRASGRQAGKTASDAHNCFLLVWGARECRFFARRATGRQAGKTASDAHNCFLLVGERKNAFLRKRATGRQAGKTASDAYNGFLLVGVLLFFLRTQSLHHGTHRGARTHDHKVKGLALCRLS